MKDLHIKKFDLNLLVVLDAVVTEGSLTRAGERLGLSQSAVSHALGRLRRLTNDDLFERGQRGMEPTQLARDMAVDVRQALDRLNAAMAPSQPFDPTTAERMFLIDLPGGTDTFIVPRLVARLGRAPGLSFRILSGRARTVLHELRYHETWLALDHEPLEDAGFRSERLSEQALVLVARKGHPRIRRSVGRALFEKLDHVALAWSRDQGMLPAGQRIEAAGIERRLKLTVPSLASLTEAIAATDMVATLFECFAREIAKTHPVEVHKLGFALPKVPVHMVWHQSFDADSGHIWLRGVIREICSEIGR